MKLKALRLTIDNDVYDFMVAKAMEYKLGARGLRSICESILTEAMYEMPTSGQKALHVTLEYAERQFGKSKMSMLKVA